MSRRPRGVSAVIRSGTSAALVRKTPAFEDHTAGSVADRAVHGQLVAEREQLTEALASVEAALARYADYYDNSPIAHVTLDRTGIVREANRAACGLLSTDRPGLLGCAVRSLVEAADRALLARHMTACRKRGVARSRLRLRARGAEDVVIPVELVSRRAVGDRECYPTAMIDGSEGERAAQERDGLLAQTRTVLERSQAKDQFFAMVSHELRSPLSALLTAVGSLAYQQANNAEIGALCEIIRRNVHSQSRLIDDLLDATRLARGKMTIRREVASFHGIVREAAALFAPEISARGLVQSWGLDAGVDVIDGDPTRLRQVLGNLIQNAIKFTPTGGNLAIRSWNSDGRIAVEVSDSGIGIAPEALERLFSPFEQVHQPGQSSDPGLGLGLAISKGLLDLHGGQITATSAGPGRGARFVVELPLAPPPAAAKPAARASIMLVEDNADTAAALELALGHLGYTVHIVTSMKAALAFDLTLVDVVVSDLRLPDGDGWTLVRGLNAKAPIPAIALSGYGNEKEVQASRDAGFAVHLVKPIGIATLVAAIDEVLPRKRAAD